VSSKLARLPVLPCTPVVLIALLVLAGWTAPTQSQDDLSTRLEQLQQLTYAGTGQEIRQAIETLEPLMPNARSGQQARFTLLKARAAALDDRLDEALDLLESVLARRSEIDSVLELRALNLITNLLVIDDRFDSGFHYFRQALALAPMVESAETRAVTYIVAADFHNRIGEHATAVEFANQALSQVERESAPRVHCMALQRRGHARLALDRVNLAIEDYRSSIELCQSIPDLNFSGVSRIGLARGLRLQDRRDQAEVSLRAAIEELGRGGFSEGELEARCLLAELLLERGGVEESERILAPTLEWMDSAGSHAIRAAAMRLHARLASIRDDLEAEYRFMRQAITFEKRQSRRIRQMRFKLLMSAHGDRERERELELLRSSNALAELARENRQEQELALTYGGFGATVAGVLLLALLVKVARDRKRFQHLSQRDGLTGLFNHTRFFELAQQSFQRARQTAEPFSLIVADVDLFKQVNDEYGHLVGDRVLARVGARLRSAFGHDAIIGRLGGEEFGVALIDCDIDTTVARIEHFRATLNRQRADDADPSITMSFGVAELAREPSLDVLYAHADQALYDAKDAGRNRVITVARIDLHASSFAT